MNDYIAQQARKFNKIHPANIGIIRKQCFIDLILRHIDETVKKVLLIGCSNCDEKKMFEKAGYEAIGIDLFPAPGILRMDMHNMDFAAHYFDLVVYSHSFEHSFNPQNALLQANKALRSGGYIAFEVPVHFKPNNIDRFDFKNWENLLENVIRPTLDAELIYGDNYKRGEINNHCGTDCAKLIVRKL